MGCLLKEALRGLCGLNHWSYAVFWKLSPQNPMLLIWEECYYLPELCPVPLGISRNGNSELAFCNHDTLSVSIQVPDFEFGNKACHLMDKMMVGNRVNVVGQGLIGGVAFTGSHLWLLSDNHCREAHLPEVVKEVSEQFSTGIRTVVVIPILPYGVIQFGSYLCIPEDVRFVYDMVSLVTQLCALQPQTYAEKELVPEEGLPVFSGYSTFESSTISASSCTSDSFSHGGCSMAQTSSVDDQLPYLLPGGIQNITDSYDIPLAQHNEHLVAAGLILGFFEDDERQKMEGQSPPAKDTNFDIRPQLGDDSFDIVGTDFQNGLFSYCGNSRSNKQQSATQGNSGSSRIVPSTDTGYLLDAVVSNWHPPVNRSWDDDVSVSCRTTLTNMSSSSVYKIENGSNENQNNSVTTGRFSKSQGINKMKHKRLKLGENPRPRPKDRQMIEDRLKELRQLVPNGAKCSIEALLEGSIKHMLFLQSITKHANKLKCTPKSKITSGGSGLLPKENFKGGATWAYELGSQSMFCPIIVEDLNLPRQMLIEMLCEEQGLFLEISNVIRGLGLTILKGTIETRDDKIQAHFIVEANRDISRMEIFLSLLGLLRQCTNVNGCVAQPHSIDGDNTMNQQFQQAASIPTTGTSCSL